MTNPYQWNAQNRQRDVTTRIANPMESVGDEVVERVPRWREVLGWIIVSVAAVVTGVAWLPVGISVVLVAIAGLVVAETAQTRLMVGGLLLGTIAIGVSLSSNSTLYVLLLPVVGVGCLALWEFSRRRSQSAVGKTSAVALVISECLVLVDYSIRKSSTDSAVRGPRFERLVGVDWLDIAIVVVLVACAWLAASLSPRSAMQFHPRPDDARQTTAAAQPFIVGRSNTGEPIWSTQLAPAASARTNPLAITALVLGVVGGVFAIPFGHIAISQINRTGEQGKGMAIAGLVLGYLSLVGLIVMIIGFAVLWNSAV